MSNAAAYGDRGEALESEPLHRNDASPTRPPLAVEEGLATHPIVASLETEFASHPIVPSLRAASTAPACVTRVGGDSAAPGGETPPGAVGDAQTFLLCGSEEGLDLRPPGEHGRVGLRAVFPPDRGGGGAGPLGRAFGPRIRVIHDLTAGLGGDAYRLARAGYRVRVVERDAVVHALLATGWASACARGGVPADLTERFEVEAPRDAGDRLSSIDALDEGVYFDPMYPKPKRASAKPRRELQILRAWLGSDEDTAPLVERACERAARVVVKRPHHAAPLVPEPSHTLESKLVRFDVYVNPSRLSGRKG